MTARTLPGVTPRAAADMRVARDAVAPLVVVAAAGADADPGADQTARSAAATPSSTSRIAPRARVRSVPSSAPVSPNAWASRAGPGQQVTVAARLRSPGAHRLDPGDAAIAARSSTALAVDRARLADDVGAPVHAVGEVHVEVAGRAEHRGVARGHAPVRVARRVVGARGTPRPPRCAPTSSRTPGSSWHEHLVEQQRRERERVAGVERARRAVRPSDAGASAACCRELRARGVELRGEPAPGPPRRAWSAACTAAPGLEQRERVGPEAGSVMHQLVERRRPARATARTSAPDARVRLAERHALLARAARRGRWPRRVGASAAACMRVGVELRGREQPARARPARARCWSSASNSGSLSSCRSRL